MATREELDITWDARKVEIEKFKLDYPEAFFGSTQFDDIIGIKEFWNGNSGQLQYDHGQNKWLAIALVWKEDKMFHIEWPVEGAEGPTWRNSLEEAYQDLYNYNAPPNPDIDGQGEEE